MSEKDRPLKYPNEIRRVEYLFEMLIKNDVFFTIGRWEKDIIFGEHSKQTFSLI